MKIAKVCLVIAALIMSVAPLFPDISPSHVFNETWPPHARFHMVWLLGVMVMLGFSTIISVIFVTLDNPVVLRAATVPGWLVLASFVLACLTVNAYGGSINAYPDEPTVLGLNGNSFGFLIAAVFQFIATIVIWKRRD